jgi:cytochrome P450
MFPATQRQLARFLAAPDDEGRYRIDLCQLLNRIFVQFVAGLIGLSGVDSEEGLDELASCAQPISDAFNSQFIDDSEQVLRLGLEAKKRYVAKFYEPSRQRYLDMLAEVKAGRLSEDEIPLTLMRLLVTHANPDYQDETVAIRESCMMFAGGGGTSVQAICWTISELEQWFEKHPDQRHLATDQAFLASALEEAMRLKAPFMPFTERILSEDTVIGDQELKRGQELRVHLTRAGRDPDVYGPDAVEFNPFRKVDAEVPRYGFGFARGRHQCFGLRIVLGTDGSGGAHGSVLKALYDAGARRDPDRAPERLPMRKDEHSIPDLDAFWHTFPVEFTDWKTTAEPK